MSQKLSVPFNSCSFNDRVKAAFVESNEYKFLVDNRTCIDMRFIDPCKVEKSLKSILNEKAGNYISTSLKGDRLRVREIKDGDMGKIMNAISTDGFHFYSFDPLEPQKSAENFIAKAKKERIEAPRETFRMAVEDIESGELVGNVTLFGVIPSRDELTGVGYFIFPQHQNKGYAKEALGVMLEMAFEKLELSHVYATVHPDNHASQKVLDGTGFMPVGYIDQSKYGIGESRLEYIVNSDLYMNVTARNIPEDRDIIKLQ